MTNKDNLDKYIPDELVVKYKGSEIAPGYVVTAATLNIYSVSGRRELSSMCASGPDVVKFKVSVSVEILK